MITTSSWRLKMGFRYGIIELELKIEVSVLYKGQDEDIFVKLALQKRG